MGSSSSSLSRFNQSFADLLLSKMFLQTITLCVLIFYLKPIIAYNANISLSLLLECKEYQIDDQYKYRDAFTILDMKNNKPYENEIFRLKFYVFTKADAHILISNEPKVHPEDPAYEIGLYVVFYSKKIH